MGVRVFIIERKVEYLIFFLGVIIKYWNSDVCGFVVKFFSFLLSSIVFFFFD